MGNAVVQYLLEYTFLRLQMGKVGFNPVHSTSSAVGWFLKHLLLLMMRTCSVYMPTMWPCSVASLLKAKLPEEASWGR